MLPFIDRNSIRRFILVGIIQIKSQVLMDILWIQIGLNSKKVFNKKMFLIPLTLRKTVKETIKNLNIYHNLAKSSVNMLNSENTLNYSFKYSISIMLKVFLEN